MFKRMTFIILLIIFIQLPTLIYAGNFNIIAENSYLILSFNDITTEIKVEDKITGKTWHSNPPERDSREKIASGSAKNRLSSQLSISYYNHRDWNITKDNYNDSMVYHQYEILDSEIDNGIKIEYTIGQKWSEDDIIPLIISEKRFNQLLEYFEEDDINFIKDSYLPLTLEKRNKEDEEKQINIYGADNKNLFSEYVPKTTQGKNETEIMTRFLDLMVNNREDISSRGDITIEDINYLKEKQVYVLASLMSWDYGDLVELINSSDYFAFILTDFKR